MKAHDRVRIQMNDLLNDHGIAGVLEALAAEIAYRKRRSPPKEQPAFERVRAMVLKAKAVTGELGI